MENQTTEDKLSVLTTIFGNDLTDSIIANTLTENNNAFDPTVEKLLTLPPNKVNQPPPPQAPPMDNKAIENIQRLHTMFGDLTQSVITTVYESNKRDVEGTVDTLLNLTSNEVASGARREAEVARQEQELRAYEEFKKVQQKLQEEERRQTEVAQQSALLRAKEEEQRKKAVEEAQRKAQEEAQRRAQEEAQILQKEAHKKAEEHAKALQEQERMLIEFQRKKAEEKAKEDEQKKLAQENAKRVEAKRLEEERKKLAEEEMKLKAEKERLAKVEAERKLAEQRKQAEERLAKLRLEEENQMLQKQKTMAEAERKLIENRMKEELQREEEEKKKLIENEKRFREEQEKIRREWEEKVRKLEQERRLEEQKRTEEEAKRAEAKRAEDEERARQDADMRKILELERLKLDEQRKRVEEEKRSAEERLKAMELAARKREEEEEARKQQEEERRMEEEERARLLEEERQARERIKEEMIKVIAQEQFAASAILVPASADEPKVEILAEADGVDVKGTWKLLQGTLPAQAWLGLFPRRAMNTNVGYMYVSGASGEFHFKGLTPGHYEVRIFANKPVTSRLAESEALLIGPKVLSFSVQLQEQHIMLEYQLDPPAVPTNKDWVGVYEKTQRRNQNYLASGYGNATGTVQLQLPRAPGVYEARLFAAGAKYNDQASLEFVVEDNDRITGELVEGAIKASWVLRTVETTSSDWIGLFAVGEASNKYLASVYTSAATTGSVDIPLPKDIAKGLYELRLFSSKVGKYVTFKTSDVITIN